MPKRLIRRYLPHPDRIIHHRSLRFMASAGRSQPVASEQAVGSRGSVLGSVVRFLPMPLQMLPLLLLPFFSE